MRNQNSNLIKKILIIDDDADIRYAVRLALMAQTILKFDFSEATTVALGVQQLRDFKPEIIILDLHINRHTGFEFLDQANEAKLLKESKVIMLTGDNTLGRVFEAQYRGVDAYHFLGKPFNIADLQALVFSLCLPTTT